MGSREIVQGEAVGWMSEHPAGPGTSVITSLPDFSELPALGFEGWRAWFIDSVGAILRWLPPGGVAIFYQSDVRREGVWVDKGYLVMRAAEEEGMVVVWHKIVCRKPPGSLGQGRPTYAHMLCLARDPRPPRAPTMDVLPDPGYMPWSRAMGVEACRVACRYLRTETETRVVVDPFCGRGTALAVANSLGFDAIGVELSARRCRAARALVIHPVQ